MDVPKTVKGRGTRAAIVEAAARLMYEQGVRATTVEDVLAASGTGKSQLYHYFTTKNDLAAAVIEHQLAVVLAQHAEREISTWAGLRRWFDVMVDGQAARRMRGCPLGSITSEMTALDEDLANRVAEAFATWQESIAGVLERMRQAGRLRSPADPARLAATTLAAIQGGYLLSTAEGRVEPLRAALAVAHEHLRAHAPSRR